MLTCREFAHRHASDYLDGQLGWRARLGVRFHLLVCDNCRRFVAQLRKVSAFLRDKPLPGASAALADTPENQSLGEHLAVIYSQQKDQQQKNSSPPL